MHPHDPPSSAMLPAELLTKTLSLVCQPTPFHQDVTNYTSPLLLGAICSSWRQLVWDTSSFWKYIYIKVSPRRSKAQAEILEAWLGRTGVGPLDVVLRLADEGSLVDVEEAYHARIFAEGNTPHDTTYAQPLFSLLVGHASRWRSLEVDIAPDCTSILTAAWQQGTPLLQKLRIRPLEAHGLDGMQNFLESAVNLAHLTIDSADGLDLQDNQIFRSDHITTLILSDISMGQLGIVLREVSATLRHFHYEQISLMFIETTRVEHGTDFPNLESLAIISEDYGAWDRMQPMFEATPKLRKLAITLHEYDDNLDEVVEFLEGRNVCLHALKLRFPLNMAIDCEESLWKLISSHSKTLEELFVDIAVLTEEAKAAMIGIHKKLKCKNGRTVLPLLKRYEVAILKDEEDDDETDSLTWFCLLPALKALKSWANKNNGQATKGIEVMLPAIEKERILKYLKSKVDAGMSIGFSDKSSSHGRIDWIFED